MKHNIASQIHKILKPKEMFRAQSGNILHGRSVTIKIINYLDEHNVKYRFHLVNYPGTDTGEVIITYLEDDKLKQIVYGVITERS